MELKKKDIEKAIEQINKEYGPDSVIFDDYIPEYSNNRMCTGIASMDYVLSGGLVRGCGAVQLFSEENVGKTSIAYIITAHVQTYHKEAVAWICSEKFDKARARNMGCLFGNLPEDIPAIFLAEENDRAEQLIDITQKLIETGYFGLVVVDSLAAFRPEDEYAKPMDDAPRQMGHPIMMMRFITKCKEALKKSPNTALLFLNQVRDSQQKVYNRFDPETHYPGGRYLRHILLAALRLKHGGFISSADETKVGRRVLIRGEKGKIVGPNGLEAGIDLYNIDCPELGFISGDFDWAKDLREVGERLGIIKTSGAWKSFGGKQIQGNSNFEREVRNSEEFSFALRKEIYNTFGIEISSGRFINARY